jgi:lambda family phage minor tail protein L
LTQNNIIWQGNTYIAAPIKTEGFEFNSQGTIPSPKISIAVNNELIPELIRLKQVLRSLGDLTGAIFKRKKTFAKFLDAVNWLNPNDTPYGFSPDPYAEGRQDIYVFDRKSADDRNILQYELTSFWNLKGIKLPGRVVTSERCVWQYRGCGCLYELASNRVSAVHGDTSTLLTSAPPIANSRDELFNGDILPATYTSDNITKTSYKINLVYKGAFSENNNNPNYLYDVGDYFYISKNGIKYYYVVKKQVPLNQSITPPNSIYFEPDECSKTIRGCRMRWAAVNTSPDGLTLPFGGFLAVNKIG